MKTRAPTGLLNLSRYSLLSRKTSSFLILRGLPREDSVEALSD